MIRSPSMIRYMNGRENLIQYLKREKMNKSGKFTTLIILHRCTLFQVRCKTIKRLNIMKNLGHFTNLCFILFHNVCKFSVFWLTFVIVIA